MNKLFTCFFGLIFQTAIFAQINLPIGHQVQTTFAPNANCKTEVMQYRLVALLAESYELGVYEKSDSLYYVYDPGLPYGHGNFDFIEASNFTSEPLYYLSEWLSYNGSGWDGYYKYYNNFNDDDLRTSTNIDAWDGVSYTGDSRVEYSYSEVEMVDTILYLDYTGGDYDSLYRHLYTYDGGVLANIIYQDYAPGWENDLLIIYTFNVDGLIDNIVYRNWDGIGWYDELRFLYSYDPDGNITEKLIQDMDFGWQTAGRYFYSYDANNFNYLIEIQEFDGVNYLNNQKFDLVEFADGLPAMNSISYWDGFIWDPSSRVQFAYEAYDDGTIDIQDELQSVHFDIYPNPTTENLTIEFTSAGQQHVSFLISDVNGQVVDRQTIVAMPGINRIQKNIQNKLASGIYQLKMVIDGSQVVKSFVVE